VVRPGGQARPDRLGQDGPVTWWRQASTSARVLAVFAATMFVGSMLVTGVYGYLLAPPKKVLVVTLVQNAGQPARAELKADCGTLPGVRVVPDQGNPDPTVQGRFPVRFDIGQATAREESALEACITEHGTLVRGYVSEGDR
jgi:hypothetical protein